MSIASSLRQRVLASPLQFLSLAIAIACSVYVFLQLQPSLILRDSTPAGGDMGAHVWGPAFMRDHLLPNLRFTGWTPDWYAGFPAYHFYMVVPSLLIILVNAGLSPVIGAIAAIVAIALGVRLATRLPRFAAPIVVASILLAIGLYPVPYGISFKLVSVVGVVLMPLAGWAMARLASSIEPVPGLVALGTTVFLFDTNFTIYGGNILSTLAGEFAFSISLALALLAIGLVVRGMDTDSHRGIAAIVIALVALCHVIPLILIVLAVVLLAFLDDDTPRLWLLGFAVTMFVALWLGDWEFSGILLSGALSCLIVAGAIVAAEPSVRQRIYWVATVGPVAALLSFFWLVPFLGQSAYFNDMGWERLEATVPALLTTPMKIAIPFAIIGAIFALALRDRIGMLFSLLAMISAAAVLNLPDGRLWNARILPFYYLAVYLVAAVGCAHVVRFVGVALSEDFAKPHIGWIATASGLALVGTLVGISIPLRTMPLGTAKADGTYTWMGLVNDRASAIPGWSSWNYSGYEYKPAYREYSDVVTTMANIGAQNGCGRAMWEYSSELDRYGTPMALMLMPFWTDGCIGSMEGLYFESSASTPFHFLNQSVLSESPSRAQRDLPYQSFDIDLGVGQLQATGVRYYMAQSDTAIAAARDNDDLTELAVSEPWVIFEVDGSELVEGLSMVPMVVSGPADDARGVEDRFDAGWISQAIDYYNHADTALVLPAEDGPAEWLRLDATADSQATEIDPAVVSNIVTDTDQVSFTVDQIGKPVLVKVSYFPNWDVDGAEGPWRAGPNLMVVIPTKNDVTLSYGRTGYDWLGNIASLLGLALLAALVAWQRKRVPWRDRAAAAEVEVEVDGDATVPDYLAELDTPVDFSEPVWSDEVAVGDVSLVEETPRNGPIEISDDALEQLLGEAPASTVVVADTETVVDATAIDADTETGGLDDPVEK